MKITSIVRKIHREAPINYSGVLESVSVKMVQDFIYDIICHGFIVLKESCFHTRSNYNSIAAQLAEYDLFPEPYSKTRESFTVSNLARTSKNMDFIEAKHNIPRLLLLFFTPQPEIYNDMIKTPDGCDYMEWLGVREGGVLDFGLKHGFCYERHAALSAKFFANRLPKHINIPSWSEPMVNALSTLSLQHQMCNGIDSKEAREIIGLRAKAFLEACGQHPNHSMVEEKLRNALYPFPSLWKRHSVNDPRIFLGYTVPWNCIAGTVETFSWGASPLRFYFDNRFFKLRPQSSFATLNDYLSRIKSSELSSEKLCSEAIVYLIHSKHAERPPAEKYASIYHANSGAGPDFRNVLFKYYLSSDSDDAVKEFGNIFLSAVSKSTSHALGRNILEQLKRLKPQLFKQHADAYMFATPKVQAIRKLFPCLDDPSRFAELLPDSLLEDQLGSDLGL